MPAKYRVISQQVLVEGYCIEALCEERGGGGLVTCCCTYLPPGGRGHVLAEVRRRRPPGTDLVAGGDINMCLRGPRDESEAEDAQTLLEWATELGATALADVVGTLVTPARAACPPPTPQGASQAE